MKRIVCIMIMLSLTIAMLRSAAAETLSAFAEYHSLNKTGWGMQLCWKGIALEGIYYPGIESTDESTSVGKGAGHSEAYSINGIYFFNIAKIKKGSCTGVPYAGLGYFTISQEFDAVYYPSGATGGIEFKSEFINLFGGFRWGNRFLYVDGRLGVEIGCTFVASDLKIKSGSYTYISPGHKSVPESKAFIALSGGIRF